MLNNVDNGSQVLLFKGVLKEWTNSLSILVTHKTKATICRVSGLIRNVKRSSSIPFVLFLPSINRPFLELQQKKKRIAASLLIVLTTTCVSFIHLNQVNTL